MDFHWWAPKGHGRFVPISQAKGQSTEIISFAWNGGCSGLQRTCLSEAGFLFGCGVPRPPFQKGEMDYEFGSFKCD